MKITSPAFENDRSIPVKYTCDGEDINPPLEISGVPEQAQSLVLIIDDTDAPLGSFIHWLVFNINPAISQIEENMIPAGAIEGKTSFGGHAYGGPCPPSGAHHYHFKLFALDIKLDLDNNASKQDVENAMENHLLDWTEIIGLYQRQ